MHLSSGCFCLEKSVLLGEEKNNKKPCLSLRAPLAVFTLLQRKEEKDVDQHGELSLPNTVNIIYPSIPLIKMK